MPSQANIKANVTRHYRSVLAQNVGATFMKVDLHVHTPASGDAQAKNKYNFTFDRGEFIASMDAARRLAGRIVQRCMALEIRLIAVTDHNTPSNVHPEEPGRTWYELLRVAADKAGKKAPRVLPGVEISTDDLHILVILDPKEGPKRRFGSSRHDQPATYIVHRIIALLQRCGFRLDEYGKYAATGMSSLFDVLGYIEELGVRCLAIPAHIDGGNKALLDVYDRQCNVYRKLLNHPNLNAVEVTKATTRAKKKIKSKSGKGTAVGVYFDRQRDRRRTPIAWVQNSDGHSIKRDGLGRRFTYIRMGKPSFTALKNALEDPRTRVVLPADYKPDDGKTVVIGMAIREPGQSWRPIAFNRSLNCIIGKRSTKKSTVVDLLLYALDRFDDDEKPVAQARLAGWGYAVEVFLTKGDNVYCCRRRSVAGEPSAPAWFKLSKLKGAAFAPLRAAPKNLALPRKYTHVAITGRLSEKTRLMEFVDWRIFGPHATFESALRARDKLLDAGFAASAAAAKKLQKACGAVFDQRLRLPDTTVKKIMSGRKLRKVQIQLDHYGSENGRALLMVEVTPGKRTGTKRQDYIDRARLYLRQGGKYQALDRLSVGTRHAAIMVLLMNEGAFGPLIVDEPERYLDVSALTGLLVPRMRQLKTVQQIICTTSDEHVLLSGDAEQVIVMQSEERIEVLAGDTNDRQIQERILEIFEGDAGGLELRKKNRKLEAILGG